MTESKWSKRFWADLAERVGATFLGALLTYVTVDNILERPDFDELWVILVVPTVVSLLKGLLANMGDAESGASLLPAPPGPEVQPEHAPVTQGHMPPKHRQDEVGESALGVALLVLVVVVIIVVLVRFL